MAETEEGHHGSAEGLRLAIGLVALANHFEQACNHRQDFPAPDGVRELACPDQHCPLGRRQAPPHDPGETAQRQPRDDGDRQRADRCRGA